MLIIYMKGKVGGTEGKECFTCWFTVLSTPQMSTAAEGAAQEPGAASGSPIMRGHCLPGHKQGAGWGVSLEPASLWVAASTD